jgi:hypothetical protein
MGGMIKHTGIVAFDDPIPDDDLDRFLSEMEAVVTASGNVESFIWRPAIEVPLGDHPVPLMVASAVVEITFANVDLLAADQGSPPPEFFELIKRWQAERPFKVVSVNHEPF